ncbi:PRD domain-containing protein [Candidatus Stoquefichus sp. SB1]|jgi:beta-glucoside operon transcriptional antiterminator|uniref:PRD domain-containing protein n=1 Tax=Candidatus Stoquefichus sp. SB1 TaxID=1658109 RepID=UPI00067EAB65|nr:PRD domain-containing protein [Candidatus Stoquefichus sp. SB1]
MIITKPLNNNVVMAKDQQQEEVIVVGTGIGFHKKAGDIIDEQKIQKVFSVADNNKLAELISQIPGQYIELTEKIVQYAKRKYNLILNENIYLGLTDHIYFALQRIQEGIDLENPFLIDIQQFYQQEYKIGLYAKEMINRMFHIQIPNDEVGYIAMHIIENSFQQKREDFDAIFKVVNESVSFIRKYYLKDVKENSLAYTRLVNHVKYFAKRFIEGKENQSQNRLLKETIQGVFKEEQECIDQLSKYLEDKFDKEMSDSEKNYLVLHLRNCQELNE